MEKLTEYNNQLLGAPGGVLLFLVVIAIGLALKMLQFFPNKAIPAVLMVIGAGLWMLLAPPPAVDASLRNWWGRNLAIGLIIPCGSWLAHKIILKRVEAKIGLFDNSDPMAFRKPSGGDPPAPPPP